MQLSTQKWLNTYYVFAPSRQVETQPFIHDIKQESFVSCQQTNHIIVSYSNKTTRLF